MRIGHRPPLLLDLRGLRCPHLAGRVRKALSRAQAGEFLEFTCTDPLAAIDIPHLIAQLGDEITAQHLTPDLIRFVVRKGNSRP
jgi:tRNA 2-thiouridine synthesizing protein A